MKSATIILLSTTLLSGCIVKGQARSASVPEPVDITPATKLPPAQTAKHAPVARDEAAPGAESARAGSRARVDTVVDRATPSRGGVLDDRRAHEDTDANIDITAGPAADAADAPTASDDSTVVEPMATERPAGIAPDNTARNKSTRRAGALTPFDQSNARADIEITAAIRRGVIDQDGLSLNARNVKIITQQGQVTLRGPVETTKEREAIASLARGTDGVLEVDEQLTVLGH